MHNKGDHRLSSIKPKKPKSREVSSRFLSPTSRTTSSSTEYGGIPSVNTRHSPLPLKPRSSTDSRKHKSLENSGSSSYTASPVTPNTKRPDTLATHLRYERFKEKSHQNSLLERQRSCTEFNRFENGKQDTVRKQSCNAVFGGSMRYTGNFKFTGNKSSQNTTSIDDQNDEGILPGRFSVYENALQHGTSVLSDSHNQESESEYSDIVSGRTSFETPAGKHIASASYMAPTVSSRKHGIEVSSKFMQDLTSKSRRRSADFGLILSDSSNSSKIFSLKNAMKKSNSKWTLSPDRKFPNPKPPTSPKGTGVGNIISRGIEMLKGKKYSASSRSPLGPGSNESVHKLRLLHNRLIQWRYSNAKADLVNGNVITQAENNIICTWNGILKLQHSVVTKKLQLQKDMLELKLNYILQSQMKELESWGYMERDYSFALSATRDYLHYVICKIPLIDGAKVNPQSASRTVRYASDVAASINLTVTMFNPVEKTSGVLVKLAKVVTQEKLLLEECLDRYRIVFALETHERSLKSNIVQLKLLQQQQHYSSRMKMHPSMNVQKKQIKPSRLKHTPFFKDRRPAPT